MNREKPEIILEKFIKGPFGESYVGTPVYKVLYRKKSKYQEILIGETPFGKGLFLDNILQLAEYDEKVFHKALVLPSIKKSFKKILILGGGDGGTAREIRRALPEAEITVVDIDIEVTKAVIKYIPSVPNGVFDDPRTKLINTDAFKYVEETSEKFDYIIGDLTDLREEGMEGSQVNRLYTTKFLNQLKNILSDDGRIVYHLEVYPVSHDIIGRFVENVKQVYRHYKMYITYIPSFGGFWSYMVMAKKPFRLKRKIEGLIYPREIMVIKDIF
jgi:spermidine synthase